MAARTRTSRDRFAQQHAATRRFSLGEPRNLTVAGNGEWVLFLRSRSGSDPLTCLWALDIGTGMERLVADPTALGEAGEVELPEAERRRRERARESAEGITAYAVDDRGERACFGLGGQLFVVDIVDATVRSWPTTGAVFDPRFDPAGVRVAYVSDRSLRVVGVGEQDRVLAGEAKAELSWGLAEFIAAEEMGRSRGFWWSPEGQHLAVCRVNNAAVQRWHIADPSQPERPPVVHRYPQAGRANAVVELVVVGLDGSRINVRWDRKALPYLANVVWQPGRPLTLVVQSRDQRTVEVLAADSETGRTRLVQRVTDERWVELVAGAPRWVGDTLVTVVDRDGARRVMAGDESLTPDGLQVRAIVGTLGEDLVVSASTEPTEVHLYRVSLGGSCRRLSVGAGVHSGTAAGEVLVVASRSMSRFGSAVQVRVGARSVGQIASLAQRPAITPRVGFHIVGDRNLRAALLVPRAGRFEAPYPVLMDPYGGPHAQRVMRSRQEYLVSQWFADQGFAVVVVDGRGTPARGPQWERAVWGDLAGPVLDDQVDALHGIAAHDERLDLGRVAIRGWSFGGYLAALAVLRRPEVFRAAVAGAPVTDWKLYDTHYTERYLGHPDEYPDHYERTSLLVDAEKLQRRLLLIHGLADDNVVVAHTLALSAALLAAGRAHSVLPLSGVTHMTPQAVIAENLLRLQLEFLGGALDMVPPA